MVTSIIAVLIMFMSGKVLWLHIKLGCVSQTRNIVFVLQRKFFFSICVNICMCLIKGSLFVTLKTRSIVRYQRLKLYQPVMIKRGEIISFCHQFSQMLKSSF